MRKIYWLDPNGKLHDSGNSHNKFAEQFIANNLKYNKEFLIIEDIVEYSFVFMHHMGWVRATINNNKVSILGNSGAPNKILRNTMNPAMNAAQLLTTRTLCNEYGLRDILDAINR